MRNSIKIAAAQIEPKLMKTRENLQSILHATKKAADNHADLVVFPECSLTGYVFSSRQEALPFAETIPGPSTEKLADLCQELKIYVIFGLLEKENDRLFNATAFVGPQGLIGKYRKNHLPLVGIDRFVDIGDQPFRVHRTPIGNIGLQICYDIVFPESSRVMALLGADIIALPTNFPQGPLASKKDITHQYYGGEKITTYIVSARAIENRVHVVSANRVGSERGILFTGVSKIVDAWGQILSLASPDREDLIYGEVSLELARQKRVILIPGEWESDFIGHRRPELYGLITKITQDVELSGEQ